MSDTTKKIEHLTEEQISHFPAIREKWMKIGLSTEPLNFEATKEAVIEAYQNAKLQPPRYFFHAGDPIDAAIMAAQLSHMFDVLTENNFQGVLYNHIESLFKAERLSKELYEETMAYAKEFYYDAEVPAFDYVQANTAWDSLDVTGCKTGEEVFKSVHNTEAAYLKELHAIRIDSVTDEEYRTHISHQVFGSHDAGWLSLYDFYLTVCGIEECAQLIPLMKIAENCGWWAPYDVCAILQDRHTFVSFDDNERLHNTKDFAVKYNTGFGICMIEGNKVPDFVVFEPEKITPEIITSESNAEVRRIMTQIYGPGKFLKDSGATLIDQDEVEIVKGTPRKMPRALLEDKTGQRWLVGTDGSTHRVYHMPVLGQVKTCKEAHESICNLDEDMCVAQG